MRISNEYGDENTLMHANVNRYIPSFHTASTIASINSKAYSTKANTTCSSHTHAEAYIKCCNCDTMILSTQIDMHSLTCTKQSQTSFMLSCLPLCEQLNIQIENMRKVFAYYKTNYPNCLQIWEVVLTIMDQLQGMNDATNKIIIEMRKIISLIKSTINRYKGPHMGFLSITKIDVIAKEKYRILIQSYKHIIANQSSIASILKPLESARLSCASTTQDTRKTTNLNGSANNINLSINQSPDRLNMSSEIIKQESKKEDALKRQFYYKCQLIKRKLGKKHQGFWVESAPLYNYAKANHISILHWDQFIENELANHSKKWIDPYTIIKLNANKIRPKKKHSDKMSEINEIESSSMESVF